MSEDVNIVVNEKRGVDLPDVIEILKKVQKANEKFLFRSYENGPQVCKNIFSIELKPQHEIAVAINNDNTSYIVIITGNIKKAGPKRKEAIKAFNSLVNFKSRR